MVSRLQEDLHNSVSVREWNIDSNFVCTICVVLCMRRDTSMDGMRVYAEVGIRIVTKWMIKLMIKPLVNTGGFKFILKFLLSFLQILNRRFYCNLDRNCVVVTCYLHFRRWYQKKIA